LNAIQRRYPQIYKSNERLLLDPSTINVGLRDFMMSIKSMLLFSFLLHSLTWHPELVPSSARSSASAATPLPQQFVPLLSDSLGRVKEAVSKILPTEKKLTPLEEAEFEEVAGEDGALRREMTMQGMSYHTGLVWIHLIHV
jgi:ATPase family AAA domain-containing protein 2